VTAPRLEEVSAGRAIVRATSLNGASVECRLAQVKAGSSESTSGYSSSWDAQLNDLIANDD